MKNIIICTFIVFAFSLRAEAQTSIEQHPDHQGVHAAISDYVEALYEADSTKIIRSVHPDLRKRGYWFNASRSEWNDNLEMTYDDLVSLAARWNKSGERANANSPKIIEIYDINERTAIGKLTAEWGMDYFRNYSAA